MHMSRCDMHAHFLVPEARGAAAASVTGPATSAADCCRGCLPAAVATRAVLQKERRRAGFHALQLPVRLPHLAVAARLQNPQGSGHPRFLRTGMLFPHIEL